MDLFLTTQVMVKIQTFEQHKTYNLLLVDMSSSFLLIKSEILISMKFFNHCTTALMHHQKLIDNQTRKSLLVKTWSMLESVVDVTQFSQMCVVLHLLLRWKNSLMQNKWRLSNWRNLNVHCLSRLLRLSLQKVMSMLIHMKVY